MVKRKRGRKDQSSYAPDPAAMQRFIRNVDAAFVRIAEALDKEQFGDCDQAIGRADRLHRHKLLNHRTVGGGAVLKASQPPPRWSSEELLEKALGHEDATAREEAISALKRLGLKMWESHGAVIIAAV